MMLEQEFKQLVMKNKWWHPQEKVLVAVSAGVDSVVLFHLLQSLSKEFRPKIIVAHINHQLRAISIEEEVFVRSLCSTYQVPFFTKRWEAGPHIKSNLEFEAREFRYGFFEEVMKQEGITKLLTAHHGDDQVETMLMRLINGSRLETLTGIQEVRKLGNGEIIRPLLSFRKKELSNYSKEQELLFYEDETNHEGVHLRNRLRIDIIPRLEKENPRFSEHLLERQKELEMRLKVLDKFMQPLFQKCVIFSEDKCLIYVKEYQKQSREEQQLILSLLMTSLQKELGLVVSFEQQKLIHEVLVSSKPNSSLNLKGDWVLERTYDALEIKRKMLQERRPDLSFSVGLNEGLYLSETEWFAFYEEGQFEIPKAVSNWNKVEMDLKKNFKGNLNIRKKVPGDRLIIDQKGHQKKVSRYFIDEKILPTDREKSWVVTDSQDEIKWLVPFRESYLSIRDETDKIHYKLVYFYTKDK